LIGLSYLDDGNCVALHQIGDELVREAVKRSKPLGIRNPPVGLGRRSDTGKCRRLYVLVHVVNFSEKDRDVERIAPLPAWMPTRSLYLVGRRRVSFGQAMKVAGEALANTSDYAVEAGPAGLLAVPLAFVTACWWWVVGMPEGAFASDDAELISGAGIAPQPSPPPTAAVAEPEFDESGLDRLWSEREYRQT
jgi:hypothetical protein